MSSAARRSGADDSAETNWAIERISVRTGPSDWPNRAAAFFPYSDVEVRARESAKSKTSVAHLEGQAATPEEANSIRSYRSFI